MFSDVSLATYQGPISVDRRSYIYLSIICNDNKKKCGIWFLRNFDFARMIIKNVK